MCILFSLTASCPVERATKAPETRQDPAVAQHRPRTHTHAPVSTHIPAHTMPAGGWINSNWHRWPNEDPPQPLRTPSSWGTNTWSLFARQGGESLQPGHSRSERQSTLWTLSALHSQVTGRCRHSWRRLWRFPLVTAETATNGCHLMPGVS